MGAVAQFELENAARVAVVLQAFRQPLLDTAVRRRNPPQRGAGPHDVFESEVLALRFLSAK